MSFKVLIVASEGAPFVKSGGLGDVIGSLPRVLKEKGIDVRIILPKYKRIKEEFLYDAKFLGEFNISLDWRIQNAKILKIKVDYGIDTYLIENDYYFYRDGYYGYGDDQERFAFFSKATIESLNIIDFIPDIIHCNDWQTAPLPLYLKDIYGKYTFLENIKTLFTIHNLQYQGIFPKDAMSSLGLSDYYFTNDKLEFNGAVNFMKAGIAYSDFVNTVSKTYSYEIQTPEYGYGLDGLLRARNGFLSGIVNGIDYSSDNSPKYSKKIYVNFDENTINLKRENKKRLQEELGLPVRDVPMISIISRLVTQKGIKLVLEIIDYLMTKDIQIVVLGIGDYDYENGFKYFAYKYSDKISANIMFNDILAQRIYAGSDMFLMPSLFEPCGLGQLFAMQYGTIPIARRTGGIADTVSHFNFETKEGNGFLFNDFLSSGLIWAIEEALKAYYDKDIWEIIYKNALASEFSWYNSADEYINLYKKILNL